MRVMRVRRVLTVVLIAAGIAAVALYGQGPRGLPGDVERASLSIGIDPRGARAPLGTYPPSSIVPPDDWATRGVRMPRKLPESLRDAPVEVRTGAEGSFFASFGSALFLTQRPVEQKRDWTLHVPDDHRGIIRVEAASVGAHVSLGVESPGDFARVTWSDGRWNYVLFSPGVLGLSTLFEVAASVR